MNLSKEEVNSSILNNLDGAYLVRVFSVPGVVWAWFGDSKVYRFCLSSGEKIDYLDFENTSELTVQEVEAEVMWTTFVDFFDNQHMKPQVTEQILWWSVVDSEGETVFFDAAYFTRENLSSLVDKVEEAELVKGYGARMSAPGYLDCTDWHIFETESEAREYLITHYSDDCFESPENL